MNKNAIIEAYCRMRTIDQTIPDEVLDFMKQAALEKLEEIDRPVKPNLSFMVYCSTNPDNVINYAKMDIGLTERESSMLNQAVSTGFKLAMQKIEKLGLITLDDLYRSLTVADQAKWDKLFKRD